MNVHSDGLRKIINNKPALKKAVSLTLRPLRKRQERHRIANYNAWVRRHALSAKDINDQKSAAKSLAYKPLISIITPTYNTPDNFFHKMVESVLKQTYDNWELIIVDDASPDDNIRKLIERYARSDPRIKYLFLKENHHIAGATNEGIKLASGEFVSLFDHDDVLYSNALFEIVTALNVEEKLDFIYTDEDKIVSIKGRDIRSEPFYKPDWNFDFLRSVNYITHFTTIRRSVLNEVGYEDKEYNGAQDWELFLRVTRHIPEANIHHIQKILYGWRIHDASTAKSFSTKPYVVESQRKALEADARLQGYDNIYIRQDKIYSGQWQTSFNPTVNAKVTIVVVGKQKENITQYIKNTTNYKNFDIQLVDTIGSYKTVISKITAEYVVIVHKGLHIVDANWLNVMLGDAQRRDIGFVTAKYKNKTDVLEDNIASLISKHAMSFVEKASIKNLTRHLYDTTRYNIPYVLQGAVMIETDKLHKVVTDTNAEFDIRKISGQMGLFGYRNLYNPYVKVIK